MWNATTTSASTSLASNVSSSNATQLIINEHIYTFLISVSIVGAIGNSIVAFVYWTKRDKQTSTFFILFLAFIDLTVCSILVPATILMEKILFETDNGFFCISYFFLLTTSVPMSSLLMLAIAFDRYFCICMVSRNIMTLHRAKAICVVLLVISGCLGVIPALETSVFSSQSNQTKSPLLNNTTTLSAFEYTCNLLN
jgi:cholecystokinin A receptor